PIAMPYYNDYEISTDSSINQGWINFAGNLDVAFFSDLQVHFHTSASTNSLLAPIYMMGGWANGSDTFFNSDPDAFDTENAGFPDGAITYSEYHDPSDDAYRTHAQRSWLNIVNLDYPLQWSYSSKSFKSPDVEKIDLMVVNIEHQTDYLSAENAEISFGAQYDGMPQINLANMAFNAIDESTGISSAFSDAVNSAVHGTIEQGMSAMENTLSDLPEKIFEPLFKEIVDPLVDDFYDALNAAYSSAPDTDYYGTVITQYIYGVGAPAGEDIDYILKNLATSADMATTLAGNLSTNLGKAIAMIDAFTSVVSVDTNGVDLGEDLPGILAISDGNYQTMTDLGRGVLQVLAETLFDSIKEDIEAELNTVLGSAAPSLEAITETLLDLRVILAEAQAQLEAAGSMTAELEATLNSIALDDTIDYIATSITDWFETIPGGASEFDEYSAEEVKAMIRKKVTDYFYSSVPCADVQSIIRSRLYTLEASIQESIDSVFQQLNKALRDLTSEYLSGIDDSINGMLGDDISGVMGSGQLDGYAHIRNDSLTELRIDGKFQWKVPSEMDFNAYLIIRQLNSTASSGCGEEGEELPEVIIGTEGFGVSWIGCDIKADISAKFAFLVDSNSVSLIGLGGAFEMVEGEIGFESFAITEFYAAVAFGKLENYISASMKCNFTDYEVEGGAFFGKACSLDPFSWDPDVQAILGDPPFTGVYVYGEGWMPIINYGCLFQIRAGVGAGIFAFSDGRIGGKILLGADGEALCVVNVGGEVKLVGIKDGDNFRMNGTGTISGRAGSCPFCVRFSKSVDFTYNNGDWEVDY
ncbi:MAG: hypothetical protein KAI74_00130, partial [Kiritimatiellae bacterium]|nr:hypothetical protein [Kiritimatiellia bacterium]